MKTTLERSLLEFRLVNAWPEPGATPSENALLDVDLLEVVEEPHEVRKRLFPGKPICSTLETSFRFRLFRGVFRLSLRDIYELRFSSKGFCRFRITSRDVIGLSVLSLNLKTSL